MELPGREREGGQGGRAQAGARGGRQRGAAGGPRAATGPFAARTCMLGPSTASRGLWVSDPTSTPGSSNLARGSSCWPLGR
eukprot:1270513-Pyramimonas_sp.AAC.1